MGDPITTEEGLEFVTETGETLVTEDSIVFGSDLRDQIARSMRFSVGEVAK